MQILLERIIRIQVELATNFLIDQIKKELEGQGHRASGELIESIGAEIKNTGDQIIANILMEDYGWVLDTGVKRSKIPYSRKRDNNKRIRGGVSQYIEGLIKWALIVKTSDRKKAKSFAFAVAQRAKLAGHPTKGSYSYSKNGRRKAWSKWAVERNQRQIEDILNLEEKLGTTIEKLIYPRS